jgi:RNA-directed DNA polymerase
LGHEQRFQAKIVNYADDLVICCRRGAEQALEAMRGIFGKLKLTVNEQKTHLCQIPAESFDFLGYTFGRWYSDRTGKAYVGHRPSKKKIQAVCRRISEVTDRRWCWRDTAEQVTHLNRIMVGWANYFCLGPVGKPYQTVTRHAVKRLRQWLCHKHQVQKGQAITRYPDPYLHRQLGLARLLLRDRNVPWAKA